jgi:carbon-monoxide dehydrogenase medium subunit
MKPSSFEYFAPTTVEEAVSLLKEHVGEAKILAGGQSLVPLLNMRMARPSIVIDLNRIGELAYVREKGGVLAIGAMTRKRDVERSELVRTRQPVLHAATLLVAHPQIRNRGTVGGSLAHADPAAEYPAVAVALDAELRAIGPGGERVIRAADFYVTYLTTALDPAEVLTEARFPTLPRNTGWSVSELSRRHGDFAIAGTVVTVSTGRRGRLTGARIVLFGVGPTPVRAREAEQVLEGEPPGEALYQEAARTVTSEIDEPTADLHGTSDYRRHLAGVLTRRGLTEAVRRASGSS